MYLLLFSTTSITILASILLLINPLKSIFTLIYHFVLTNSSIRIIKKYLKNENYSFFKARLRLLFLLSNERNIDLIVKEFLEYRDDLQKAYIKHNITELQVFIDTRIFKIIENDLKGCNECKLYRSLRLIQLFQFEFFLKKINENFDNYSGRGQFYTLYSFIEFKNFELYQFFKKRKKHFSLILIEKLDQLEKSHE